MFKRFISYGRSNVLPFLRPRPVVKKEKREKTTPGYFYHGNELIRAHTKSEARAQLKAKLGIPRKGRLPVGMFAGKA